MNYGIITLLPKVSDASRVQKFRPICLLNCLYKLITKVLMIRLEKVAEKLIHPNQTTFMKGRNIMSGIMILHEILHETKRKKQMGSSLNLISKRHMIKLIKVFFLNAYQLEVLMINGANG
jgi:hypothetical protein